MTTPQQSRGQPRFEGRAAEAIAAAMAQRPTRPGYEPYPMSEEERREALRAQGLAECRQCKDTHRADLCCFCGCIHALASTGACPRLVEVERRPDGQITRWRNASGTKWMDGRAVPVEDLTEKDAE